MPRTLPITKPELWSYKAEKCRAGRHSRTGSRKAGSVKRLAGALHFEVETRPLELPAPPRR
jgi:hypothetical protein